MSTAQTPAEMNRQIREEARVSYVLQDAPALCAAMYQNARLGLTVGACADAAVEMAGLILDRTVK